MGDEVQEIMQAILRTLIGLFSGGTFLEKVEQKVIKTSIFAGKFCEMCLG